MVAQVAALRRGRQAGPADRRSCGATTIYDPSGPDDHVGHRLHDRRHHRSCGATSMTSAGSAVSAHDRPAITSVRRRARCALYLQAVVGDGRARARAVGVGAVGTPHPLAWLALAGLALSSGWFRLNFTSVVGDDRHRRHVLHRHRAAVRARRRRRWRSPRHALRLLAAPAPADAAGWRSTPPRSRSRCGSAASAFFAHRRRRRRWRSATRRSRRWCCRCWR